MQALIDVIIGFVAMLCTAALAQFGVDMADHRREPEVQRVHHCQPRAPESAAPSDKDC